MKRKDQIATEISHIVPTFLRHMFPYVFNPIDVPPSQVIAMVAIEEKGGCTLTELRREMHVSAPTITGIIDRLVRDNFVKRSVDLSDRRVKNVVLTDKGKKLTKKFRENIRKRWSYILSKMPIETGETVVKTMTKITKGFKDGSI